jgi:hypothetical protein
VAKQKSEARGEAIDRIANLLGLLLVKDLKPGEKILTLIRAGFSDDDISTLLNTTAGNIRQTRYASKKK